MFLFKEQNDNIMIYKAFQGKIAEVKLLILPKKGAFVSFLKITTSLPGKGYLQEKRKALESPGPCTEG
jgi:hypothetical protein